MDFFDSLKSNRLIILIISIVINIILIFGCCFLLYKYLNYTCVCENENFDLTVSDEEIIEQEKFYVEIKGAVKNPGVYEVDSTNIINDIVKLSGGFTKKAYTKNINLSRKVSNELVIYVYTETEYKKAIEKEAQPICECATYDISNCVNNVVSEIVSSDKDTSFENDIKQENNKLVNINSASKEELMTVSGIGESKADNIIEYRTANGSFKSIEEIKNVNGIGDSLYEKIKDSITI
ncbi:MAG: helix-hairpin-helix domain-containing protein [Bacilli bacterium]|nr:helix-hairpin-helix domain-containing protein [Bacilli bacterium]